MFLLAATNLKRVKFSGSYVKEGLVVVTGLIVGPIIIGLTGEIANKVARKLRG